MDYITSWIWITEVVHIQVLRYKVKYSSFYIIVFVVSVVFRSIYHWLCLFAFDQSFVSLILQLRYLFISFSITQSLIRCFVLLCRTVTEAVRRRQSIGPLLM